MKKVLMAIGGMAYVVIGGAITETILSDPQAYEQIKKDIISDISAVGINTDNADKYFDSPIYWGAVKGGCSCILPAVCAGLLVKDKIEEVYNKIVNNG